MTPTFSLRVMGIQEWDPLDDNVDILVVLADGRRFGATVFTVKNLETLMDRHARSGECAGGLYIWATKMIVMRELSLEGMHKMVETLIADHEFEQSFELLESPEA